ncbi:UvrD-helicase domain-containing protein [Bradyrhizobium sp. 180]|uniref:ATP-dependent helicase n=1 Tax=unclassified Bradyrhizobium TaxID=2631580 RepID=UPI001FFC1685|nr:MULTISPECIES: UvrD-helicase domain-containing protein [unclassified Bradyrhizobium]MCK1422095.1 UvrD-helicase domain-containing protein [Bradyrhizobium sp. CW12]MCK1492721.1 UvrD-helicase domain-containing protein [Bradyrhizobium sp. 180]MCK1528846.1 UvrD-helicase domain-containing protein [Bradyrhizobium sp. 182]MCK1598072.1 UvrD-helicase domain-containing protein [Bradyrhizobium sp. 164]MCK1620095.1 UvrD-helicase domain-containing protein [Bradyrhizobium sp. 159]
MIRMTEPSKITNVPDHQPAAGGIAARARASVGPKYLSGLNPEQREAVETLDGPVLVLAGAGTGKTRVLTTRIAHILSQGRARPAEILSVTFTNKAAREMKHRLGQMLGHAVEGMPWLGTFHSIGGRILRVHAELAQLKSNFTVLDVDDQVRLLKQLLQAENIDDKRWPARMLAGLIDGWKNRGLMPSQVPSGEAAVFANGKGGKLYASYQERLKILNAADFGDLLLENIRIFREHPDILRQYQQRFKFILVDEYQDTNVAQYLWLRLLSQAPASTKAVIPGRVEDANPESGDESSARDSGSAPSAHPGMTVAAAGPTKNICCVGDDDQSIYGWRGAEVDNILRFEHDFPGAKVIRLERNYRSTGHILAAASHLIAHNEGRLGKTLRTEDQDGEKVTVTGSWDSEEEARGIGEEIEQLQRQGEKLNEIAILVRASYQMREFEDRFVTLGLPYRVIGGPRFYERAEIRDALAYLRVINSPADDLAFERIVNTPKRGLGDATVQMLHDHARKRRIPLFEAARAVVETDELKPKARGSLRDLITQFDRWRTQREVTAHTDLAQIVLDESGYTEMWQKDRSADAAGRLENLKELVRSMEEFENLQGFLEHISLVMDRDGGAEDDAVSLMTLHSAKGLEFDNVFLPGWEEGLFPSQRTLDEQGRAGLEEERRLGHVGLTRARRRAMIYFATNRRIHGTWSTTIPSRFLDELPAANVEITESKGGSAWGGTGGYGASRFDDMEAFGSSYSTPGWQRAQANRNRGGQGRNGGGRGGFEEETASFSSSSSPDFGSFSSRRRGPLTIEGELVAKSTGTTSEFSLEDRVFHQKFGYGRVTKIDGNKLTIAFDKAGEKKVVDSFVQRA